jgi:catechol 2,3-dioxygenase
MNQTGNDVELYWDRPKEVCPKNKDGGLDIFARTLDVANPLSLAELSVILKKF